MKKSVVDSFRGEYFFLSNFYSCEIWWEGILYPSTEHAYQASKTLDNKQRKKIAKAATPDKAKGRGRQLILRDDWERIKVPLMKELLERKFEIPELKEKLLNTGDSELIEGNNWNDFFWGKCHGKGENWLGKLLMQIRDNIKERELPINFNTV